MTEIKWQQPPAHGNARSLWTEVAEALKSNPGTWALLRESERSANLATAIRTGRYSAFRPVGDFESRSVKTDSGFDTYARYVGEVQA